MYKQYGEKADFKIVYIREAHPTDGWRIRANDQQGIMIEDPKTFDQREEVANVCIANLKTTIPTLIDNMDNTVEKNYQSWPDRIYIIDKKGNIVYQSEPGPRGFKPVEAEEALKKILEVSKSK